MATATDPSNPTNSLSQPDDTLAAKTLPKPITVSGSAVGLDDSVDSDQDAGGLSTASPQANLDDQDDPVTSNSTDLPMPVVFGEDEEDQAPPDNEDAKVPDPEQSTAVMETLPEPVIGRPVIETLPADGDSQPGGVISPVGAIDLASSGAQSFTDPLATVQPVDTIASLPTQEPSTLPTQAMSESSIPSISEPTGSFTATEPLVMPEKASDHLSDASNSLGSPTSSEFTIPALQQTSSPLATGLPSVPASIDPSPEVDQRVVGNPLAPIPADQIQNVMPLPLATDLNSLPPQLDPPTRSKGAFAKVALGMVAVLVGCSVVVGGYFASKQFLGRGDQTPTQAVVEKQPVITSPKETTPIKTPQPTPEVTPKPKAKLNRAILNAKILNGSGVKGEAGRAKTTLDTAGYKKVDTGNADHFEYTQTTVDYKPDLAEFLDAILADLKSYNAVAGDKLKTSDPYDLYITLGNPEAEEANASTETAEPQPTETPEPTDASTSSDDS